MIVKLICFGVVVGWSDIATVYSQRSALDSRPPSILPHDSHDDALDLHLVGIGEDWLHGGVGRLQADLAARIAIELLERDVGSAKQRDDHLAVVRALAVLDDDKIADRKSVV